MNKSVTSLLFFLAFLAACSYTEKIKDGKTAYERKQYAVAKKMLSEEYKKSKSSVEKGKQAFMLAECYRHEGNEQKASQWYFTAYSGGYGADALKEYAYALKRDGDYDEAKKAFKDVGIEMGSPYEFRREITACKQAKTWATEKDKNEYKMELLEFNSRDNEYSPTLKGKQLIITSDRKKSTGEDIYGWTGNKYADLFTVDVSNNDVKVYDEVLNSEYNEGTLTFNKAGTEVFFTRCGSDQKEGDDYCKLMYSKKQGETWSKPKMLEFVAPKTNYGHPSLSDDGNTLYFSSNHKDGFGGFDVYSCTKTTEGWTEPDNLGFSINSEGNEMFPHVDVDTLYFSSDFHIGMGGLDIFKTYKRNGKWSPYQNLKAPINSSADDFGLIVDYQATKTDSILQIGYLASNRKDGIGGDDIYKFQRVQLPAPPPVIDSIPVEEIVYKMILNGQVLGKEYRDPNNPNSGIVGKTPLANSKVQINFRDTTIKVTTDNEGRFSLDLEENRDYSFFASQPNYFNNNARFSTRGIVQDKNNPIQTFNVEVVLDKIFKNTEITLDNIYYDYTKWDIRPDAEPTLNTLTNLLNRNPRINIQLSSHTDCRGKADYNLILSQKRAQAAVDYLIAKGINPSRLTAKGYGASQLLEDCVCSRCSDEEHQRNRRTTFKVIE